MRKSLIGVAAAVALLFAADSMTFAQEKKPKKTARQTQDQGVDEAADLAPVPERAAAVIVHPSGAVSSLLDESYMEAMVAVRDANGAVTFTCVHGLKNAEAHAKTAASQPTKTAPRAGAPEVK